MQKSKYGGVRVFCLIIGSTFVGIGMGGWIGFGVFFLFLAVTPD